VTLQPRTWYMCLTTLSGASQHLMCLIELSGHQMAPSVFNYKCVLWSVVYEKVTWLSHDYRSCCMCWSQTDLSYLPVLIKTAFKCTNGCLRNYSPILYINAAYTIHNMLLNTQIKIT